VAVERLEGLAAELHGRALEPADRCRVQVLVPRRPALVLGSTQRSDAVDDDALARRRLDLVRRRSGGGAVLVTPDDPLWVDVDLPRGDPRWADDVTASFAWLGAAWAGALGDVGLEVSAHPGPFEPGPWGRLVCFAGRGPGEVFREGRKVVGIAQRRTRAGARFQCALARRWDPEPLVDLLVEPGSRTAARAALADVAVGIDVDVDAVVAALAARIDAA
jgi:lipoate-protein ligase A